MVQPPYPKPFDEEYRLRVLQDLSILDTEPEPEFDRLVSLAQRHFNTKIAIVSLIDADRQWFKAATGLDAKETPREHAFCAHTIIGNSPLVVLDATNDKRFDTNPFVVGAPHIRFYAGAPLIVKGVAIGTLCVVDDKPRQSFEDGEAESLTAFVKIVEDELTLRENTRRKTEALTAKILETQTLAEAAENAKAQFLALMSHELRTPLNAVIGFAECIEREILGPLQPAKYKEFAERIAIGGRRQLNLIERLLELTNKGRVDIDEEVFNLQPLIERCVESLSGETLIAGVRMETEPCAKPISVRADRVHIEQIALELIGNAIKFTPKGGQIRVALDLDASNCVTLTVSDTGSGIAPEALGDSLSVFGQISPAHSRKYGGAGIGLPIVKKLAELHGAELTLLAPAGGGTRAQVRFPAYRTTGA